MKITTQFSKVSQKAGRNAFGYLTTVAGSRTTKRIYHFIIKRFHAKCIEIFLSTIQNKWNIYNVTTKSDRFAFSADLNTIDRTATQPLNSRQSAQNCNTADFPFLPSHILQLVARELNQEQLYKWTLFRLHRLHAPCALPVQSKWKEKEKSELQQLLFPLGPSSCQSSGGCLQPMATCLITKSQSPRAVKVPEIDKDV